MQDTSSPRMANKILNSHPDPDPVSGTWPIADLQSWRGQITSLGCSQIAMMKATLLVLILSCWKYGACEKNCTDGILNQELACTDPDFELDDTSPQLSINCTGSSYLITHDIPYDSNAISYIRLAVICGSDCEDTDLFLDPDHRQPKANFTGQHNITNVTECVVTGCYFLNRDGGSHLLYNFGAPSCQLGPESVTLESTDAGETTTVAMETTTTDVAAGTTLPTAIVVSITLFIVLLSLICIVVILLSIKRWRVNGIRLYHSQLYHLKSISPFNDEFEGHVDIDPVKIGLSKVMSASEPSLLFALNQLAVHVTDASELNKYLQPSIRSETPFTFSQEELECNNVGVYNEDGPLDFNCHDHVSVESSLSLEDSDHQTSSIQLDQTIKHEEEEYCEIEDTKLSTNYTASNALDLELLTSNSGILDQKHYRGYIDYGSKTISGYDKESMDDINELNSDSTHSEHPVDIDRSKIVSSLMDLVHEANSNATRNEIHTRDLTTEFSTDENVIDNCAVIFDFTASDAILSEDNDDHPATVADSASQEDTSVAIAFDFGTSPSHLQSGTDDHVVTLLEEAAATSSNDYIEVPRSDFTPADGLHDSVLLDDIGYHDKMAETGYMASLDSFKLSSDNSISKNDLVQNCATPFERHGNGDVSKSSGYISSETLQLNSGLNTWFT